MSFTRVSLLSGAVCRFASSPALLPADYNAGTNRWYALCCSTVVVVSASFMLAWLRLKSDSVAGRGVPCQSQCFAYQHLDSLIRDTGSTLSWYTTELAQL